MKAAAQLFLVIAVLTGGSQAAMASSHREAPGTTLDQVIDGTDTYAWVAADAPDKVTLVANWVPILEPAGGPNFFLFDPNAIYYVNIDNVGDALDHIRYEFTFRTSISNGNTFLYNTGEVTSFNDPDLNIRQYYNVTRIDDGAETVLGTDLPVAPNYVGPKSMPNYAALAQEAIRTLSDGTKVFVGPRDDPFFVDTGSLFDLLTIRKLPGDKGKGVDGLGGFDILAIALQVPMTRLTRDGQPGSSSSNPIIGVYQSTERLSTRVLNADGTQTHSGSPIQVSRLGHPLVNEVVISLKDKDKFNASKPTGDAQFLSHVVDPELARLLNLLYGISVPPTPRNDLVSVFLTGVPGLNQPAGVTPAELLRLNLSIAPSATPNRFGVIAGDNAGFPNGRRLIDDVVDIELRVVAGVLVPGFNIAPNNRLGDGVDANDVPFLPYFPYISLPHDPLDHQHHREQHGSGDSNVKVKGADAGIETGTSLKLRGPTPGSRIELEYSLASSAKVNLTVFDVQGKPVRTLINQDAAAGTFRAAWSGVTEDGSSARRGVYFARLVVDGQVADTRKLVLN